VFHQNAWRRNELVSGVEATEELKSKKKNRYAQKCQKTVRGIHVVSPEEEKRGYGEKDLE